MIYPPRVAAASALPWFAWGWLHRPAAPRRAKPIVIAARRIDRRQEAEAAVTGLAAAGEITETDAKQAVLAQMLRSVTAPLPGEDGASAGR